MISTLGVAACAAPFAWYAWNKYVPKERVEDGLFFTNNIDSMPSAPNPVKLLTGLRWSNGPQVNNFNFEGKTDSLSLNVSKFTHFERTLKSCKIDKNSAKKAWKYMLSLSRLALTRQLLLLGSQGSGKTVAIRWWLKQNMDMLKQHKRGWYDRAIIHDRKNDYVKQLVDNKRCFTINFFDKNGIVWDIFGESEFDALMPAFITNLVNGGIFGANTPDPDFFSNGARDRLVAIFRRVKHNYPNLKDSKNCWKMLINEIMTYKAEIESGDSKQTSEKDIWSTIKLCLETIETMAFRIIEQKAKTFTIAKFYTWKNATLIMSYGPNGPALTAYYTGFMAAVITMHLTRGRQVDDFTLFLLDEYLSFSGMTLDDKIALHTACREGGAQVIMAMQNMPMDDEKLLQTLDSSRVLVMCFSIDDLKTKQHLCDQIGVRDYKKTVISKSTSSSKGGGSKSTNVNDEVVKGEAMVTPDVLNNPGEYKHIIFAPKLGNDGLLFVGTTDYADFPVIRDPFIPADLTALHIMRSGQEVKHDVTEINIQLADLYKSKTDRLKEHEKFNLWLQWEAAKRNATEQTFLKEQQIAEAELDLIFQKYNRNQETIANKMRSFSLAERWNLFQEWIRLQTEGTELEKYEFVEKNGLHGAMPDFFDFTEEQRAQIKAEAELKLAKLDKPGKVRKNQVAPAQPAVVEKPKSEPVVEQKAESSEEYEEETDTTGRDEY